MISETIRNRTLQLMELRRAGKLTGPLVDLALAGYLTDADAVARIETAPVPESRRTCADAGILDFVGSRLRRIGGSTR
jgi:hypothetical protein